ncbi:MAG: DNA mismatch repair endonuclease MutL [Candidatus Izemoplasmatales bacterium]|jgi:DNA mismatch repair protein MutL|nr:DNA mismatch repair endonuclease MutL [Candidatus Izemoplasmatales bacterium]
MGVIKRLDANIANKIAAGEVVEKLANIVKELVENSIDASSTKIDIDLLESGMKKITVTDNGSGMEESDAFLAFERHATSKIKNVNDLFRIQSLGFRGEALPSIAAISRVELTTAFDNQAINIVYEDGKLIESKKAALNKGTRIEVSRIFYSTPARFKYLKSPQYELGNIVNLVNGFALANPKISFRLTNDKKEIFISNNNDSIVNIIAQIYGVTVAKNLIYFESKNRDYRISGYTTNPIINRASRNYINIIVNNRSIQNKDIVSAISEAYDQLIPKNRYPIAVIYIEVDPLLIDVNIHPRKQEIKFSEKEKLIELIKKILKEKLEITKVIQSPEKDYEQTKFNFSEKTSETKEKTYIVSENKEEKKNEKTIIPDMEYIGQYSGTYLIFQNEEGLYLLDQHAAAERIRYERYLKKWSLSNQEITELLTPLSIESSNENLIKLEDKLSSVENFGLKLKIADNKILIKAIPNWFPKDYEEIYTETIIDKLISEDEITQKAMVDDLAKLLACKHSLKANHYISNLEANQLLKDLRECKRPYTCPHGRPIIVSLSNRQIEYWFNRVI